MTYKQLTQEQRYQIYVLLKTAHSQSEIADAIDVHRSTISRELTRNSGKRGYRPQQAQRLAVSRQKKARCRIERSVWEQVEEKLRLDWTPEQIASLWNAGRPDPTGIVGINRFGVPYDTPKYVEKFKSAYKEIPPLEEAEQKDSWLKEQATGFLETVKGRNCFLNRSQ